VRKHEQAPEYDFAELSNEQIIELIEAERRRILVQKVLRSLPGT
jgi:hypothetical protein